MPHYRKLQKIGGSSFFITLPKSWIQKNSLTESTLISLTESATGDLIVSPPKLTESIKSSNLKLNDANFDVINRMIVSAYINGCSVITVSSSNKQNLKNIAKYIENKLPGLILTSEGDNFLSLKFVLDLSSVNFMDIFERVNRITSFMCNEVADEKAIKEYDAEIDRLYFLLVRLLRTAIMDSSLAKVIGLTAVQILDFRLVLHSLERFGDELVALSGRHIEEPLDKIKTLKERAIKAFIGDSNIEPHEIEKLKVEAYRSLVSINNDSTLHLWRLIELASDIADLSETLYRYS